LARGKAKKEISPSPMGKGNKSKEKGGLGTKDLRKMNISLLCKWWQKVETGSGIWHDIVQRKYMKSGGISQLKKAITILLCGMICLK